MGLISKRKSLSFLLDSIAARSNTVILVLVAVGLLGLLAVPFLEREINFDENALLAGSARPTIRVKSPDAYTSSKRTASDLARYAFTSRFTHELQQQIRQQLGLQVFNHTYLVNSHANVHCKHNSSRIPGCGKARQRCSNVHTVLESRRGDGKEALVLVTPINHQEFAVDFEQDVSGVKLATALGFAMLQHLKVSAPWLAKDVIWVIPDASCGLVESMQAWTDAYQHPSAGLRDGSLKHFGRSGVLQQALVFEVPTGSFNQLQVSLEGYEGLLPKLDMFWLLRWYCWQYVTAPFELPHSTSMHQFISSISDKIANALLSHGASSMAVKAIQVHLLKLTTMAEFMWRQARGLPHGAHAAFKGLMVDAATLRVLTKDPQGSVVGARGFLGVGNLRQSVNKANKGLQLQPQHVLDFDTGLVQLGDVLELTLRSCSVLIERYHHSLFLYVLTGLDRYVSVERYIVPLVALITALVVKAASLRCGPAKFEIASSKDGTPQTTATPETWVRKPLWKKVIGAVSRRHDEGLQQEDEANGESEELVLEDPLQVMPPELAGQAAADRTAWVTAIQLVAAAHVLSVIVGCLLRFAPELVEQLEPQVLSGWLAAALAAPSKHVGEWGLGLGVLCALLFAVEGVKSGAAASYGARHQNVQGQPAARARSGSGWFKTSFPDKVLVVELSVVAAALAAVACLNWALGYVACLVLVPLALACGASVSAPKSSSSDSCSSASSTGSRTRSVVVLTVCSPFAVLLLLMLMSGVRLMAVQEVLRYLQWMVLQSSMGAYMLSWAVYVPFWCLSAWSHVQNLQ